MDTFEMWSLEQKDRPIKRKEKKWSTPRDGLIFQDTKDKKRNPYERKNESTKN